MIVSVIRKTFRSSLFILLVFYQPNGKKNNIFLYQMHGCVKYITFENRQNITDSKIVDKLSVALKFSHQRYMLKYDFNSIAINRT